MADTILLLGGLMVAAVLAFIGLWLGLAWLCDLLRDRYHARRKHVLHTTAGERRRIFDRTEPPMGNKIQREAAYDTLRELPARGLTIYTDHNVWLPHTPAAAPRPAVWWPPVEPGPPIVGSLTDVPDRRRSVGAERLATDTDVRTAAAVLPAWVIAALNGHDGVDACVESIVARAVTP